MLPAAGVDPLAEVALAVHQADRDERQRAVGRLLEDVAGERAEAAGVDRQRAVHAELRAEVRDRALGRRRAARRPGARGRRATAASTAAIALEQRRRRPRRARAPPASASPSSRTGFSPQRSQRAGIDRRRTARGRRASTTSGSCRRGARGRPAAADTRAASAVGGAQEIVVAGSHRRAMMAASRRRAMARSTASPPTGPRARPGIGARGRVDDDDPARRRAVGAAVRPRSARPASVALRLALAALILWPFARPRLRGRSRADLGAAVALGACSGLLTLAFFEAIARIPLGVAVTIEFLGPLGVALAGSRHARDVAWVVLAGAGRRAADARRRARASRSTRPASRSRASRRVCWAALHPADEARRRALGRARGAVGLAGRRGARHAAGRRRRAPAPSCSRRRCCSPASGSRC